MHWIDVSIVIFYLIAIAIVGLCVSGRASKGTGDYFLGGRNIPWYILGISGMATFVDMGGTARQCAGYLLFGAKGFWLCFDGAIALLLSFQMIYAAKWMRRSEVMTNAEWMIFRFGPGAQGQIARLVSACSALVVCVALMSFFFIGTSQVLPVFIPEQTLQIGRFVAEHVMPASWQAANSRAGEIESVESISNPISSGSVGITAPPIFSEQVMISLGSRCISAGLMSLIALYTVCSGFYGVVVTDVVQAGLIFVLILIVAYKAFILGTPEYFDDYAPQAWLSLWPQNGIWTPEVPAAFSELGSYGEIAISFGALLVFWIANNILQGMATPFDAWTAQRYYAAKDEREASLCASLWIVLWSFRFLLLAGVGVIALSHQESIVDPEHALSVVILEAMPIGVVGLLFAALLAAQMSTVDTTANSSAAYFVNDIYMPFMRPKADKKECMKISYLITLLLMVAGTVIGMWLPNVDTIWGWIMMGLFVGTLPPNIAKWFWWRTNGYCFAAGSIAGIVAALCVKLHTLFSASVVEASPILFWLSELPRYWGFSIVFACSAAFTLAVALLTTPCDSQVIRSFYEKTRPFGFWGPVRDECQASIVEQARSENRDDLLALPIACVWQTSLFLLMSSIVLKRWGEVTALLVVTLITSYGVYKLWYLRLKRPIPNFDSH
jgi:Na+/proline symporter